MGGIYAAKLYDMLPTLVKIIANKSKINAFRYSGITINDNTYQFDFVSPEDVEQPADLIIIAVKYAQLKQAIEDIKGFIDKNTIVISLLNGISSEAIIGDEISQQHVLYAYGVGMDAVRDGASIRYTNPGKIVFGEKNNSVFSERVVAIKNLFEKAKIPYQIPVDMRRSLWYKFMMNVGINQASAVLKAPYGVFQQNKNAKQLMLMAATEVVALSNCCGIDLNQADMDEFVRIVNTLDPVSKTSMLQDIEAKRKTEVDIFAGTVIELGKNITYQLQ